MALTKGDTVTYAGLVTSAVLQAIEPWRKEAAMPAESHPVLASAIWSYLPLILLTVVGIIWLVRQFTHIGIRKKSTDDFNKITQVFHKTFANQTVPLDNLEYVDCLFDNVTFMYEGKGIARMFACRFAQPTKIMLKSNNNAVSQAILIMTALSGAMGGKMPDTLRIDSIP